MRIGERETNNGLVRVIPQCPVTTTGLERVNPQCHPNHPCLQTLLRRSTLRNSTESLWLRTRRWSSKRITWGEPGPLPLGENPFHPDRAKIQPCWEKTLQSFGGLASLYRYWNLAGTSDDASSELLTQFEVSIKLASTKRDFNRLLSSL